MGAIVARKGRELQRYNSEGGRLVVGCIPYRMNPCSGIEVLVISSQKDDSIMFPKGGWEADESIEAAASREAVEEAGVVGRVEGILGKWRYESKRYGTTYEGSMFPLNVTDELTYFPEMETRKKRWVSIDEARIRCRDWWMKAALEIFWLRKQQSVASQ